MAVRGWRSRAVPSPGQRARAGMVVAAVLGIAVGGCTHSPAGQGRHPDPSGAAVASGSAGSHAGGSPSTQPVRLVARRLPATLPAPVSDAVVFVDGSTLVVAGGLTAQDTSTAAVVRVDPVGNRVIGDGRLAAAVHDAAGLSLGGVDLLLGGGTSTSVATVQLLRRGQSSQVAGALPQPRSDLVATVSGGMGYVLGGYTGSRMLADVLQTADGRSFRAVASLPVPVRYPAVAASGGQLWLFGGVTGAGTATDAVQRVDLGSGTARVVGHLPRPVAHAAGFTLGTAMYVAGGQTPGGGRTNAILRVDSAGAATQVGTLPGPLSDAGVAVSDGVAYLVGGQTPTTEATVVEIRPAGG